MARLPRYNLPGQPHHVILRGNYRSIIFVGEEDYHSCYRYIELNPVRANMVVHPREHPWSSYLCHAEGKIDKLIADSTHCTLP